MNGSVNYNATQDFSKHNKEFEGLDAINHIGILLAGKEPVDKGSLYQTSTQNVPTVYTACT